MIITLVNGIELRVSNFYKVYGMAAVYIIVNSINNKAYIGSSVDVVKRKNNHFGSLNRNKHPNIHLQNAYNKYGNDAFTMYILEYVNSISDLLDREQYWLDKTNVFDRNIGYNNSPSAYNTLGVKHSEEANLKKSKSVLQYDLEGNFIKEWISATDAQKVEGFNVDSIYKCTSHKNKQHKGYIWVLKEEAEQEDFDINKLIPKPYNNKPIYQCDEDGNIIREWDSITYASRELKLCAKRIVMCCKGKVKIYKNFTWKYKLIQ